MYFRKFSLMKYFSMPSKLTSSNFSTIIPLESSIPGQTHEDLLGGQKDAAKLLLPPPAPTVSSGQLNADVRKSLFSEHLGGSLNLEVFQDLFYCVLSLPNMLIHCLSFQLPGNGP